MIDYKTTLLNFGCFQDNTYLDMYVNLIEQNLNNTSEKCVTQKHHIIPRKFYYLAKLPCDNSSLNLINLKYKDHILAHYYLCFCTEGNHKKVNEEALFFLINQKVEDIDLSQLDRYQEIYEDLCRRKSDSLMGRHISQEVKERLSKVLKGKQVSDETRQLLREQKLGDKNPMKREDVRKRSSLSHIGQSAWNKGLHHSDETKKKISEAKSGEKHQNWGKHLSQETRNKISESNKGKVVSQETRDKLSKSISENAKHNDNYGMKGKHHSEESKEKMSNVQQCKYWITNGVEDKRINASEEIPSGFYAGRVKANGDKGIHNKGKLCFNNGIEQVYITEDDIQKYEQLGYVRGGLPRKRKNTL